MVIERLFEVAIVGLLFLFCLRMLFFDSRENQDAQMAELVGAALPDQAGATQAEERLREYYGTSGPQLRLKEQTCKTGEMVELWDWIEVRLEGEESWKTAGQPDIYVELLGMKRNGEDLGRELFDSAQAGAGTVANPVHYWEERGTVCFYRDGYYDLELLVTDSYGRSCAEHVTILVEEA